MAQTLFTYAMYSVIAHKSRFVGYFGWWFIDTQIASSHNFIIDLFCKYALEWCVGVCSLNLWLVLRNLVKVLNVKVLSTAMEKFIRHFQIFNIIQEYMLSSSYKTMNMLLKELNISISCWLFLNQLYSITFFLFTLLRIFKLK